jgi:hypothetical protein
MRLLVVPDIRRKEGLADRFPMRNVRAFLCLAGQFYFYFKLSPSYAIFVRKTQDFPSCLDEGVSLALPRKFSLVDHDRGLKCYVWERSTPIDRCYCRLPYQTSQVNERHMHIRMGHPSWRWKRYVYLRTSFDLGMD